MIFRTGCCAIFATVHGLRFDHSEQAVPDHPRVWMENCGNTPHSQIYRAATQEKCSLIVTGVEFHCGGVGKVIFLLASESSFDKTSVCDIMSQMWVP
jgi:hypothetical protein